MSKSVLNALFINLPGKMTRANASGCRLNTPPLTTNTSQKICTVLAATARLSRWRPCASLAKSAIVLLGAFLSPARNVSITPAPLSSAWFLLIPTTGLNWSTGMSALSATDPWRPSYFLVSNPELSQNIKNYGLNKAVRS